MKKIRCLIIEDEPIAARIVESYIKQVEFLSLEGICSNAVSALKVIADKEIDILFLDIHLPKIKGIDFLKTLSDPPAAIITSAYDQYAIESFELEIIDYLLKPFSFPRFLKAVNRLKNRNETSVHLFEREHRYFNVNKKMVKVYLDEILYIESFKEYIKIHTGVKSILTKFQIGEMEALLPPNRFIRTHRSFIVSKKAIESYTYEEIQVNGKLLPLGRSYAEALKKILKSG